jgi:hypothetical protein
LPVDIFSAGFSLQWAAANPAAGFDFFYPKLNSVEFPAAIVFYTSPPSVTALRI